MIDAPNQWRLDTPGHVGWERTAQPGDPNKYFMVSCDSHVNEHTNLLRERLDAQYRDRLPRIEVSELGVQWQVSDGLQRPPLGEDQREAAHNERAKAGADPVERLKHIA